MICHLLTHPGHYTTRVPMTTYLMNDVTMTSWHHHPYNIPPPRALCPQRCFFNFPSHRSPRVRVLWHMNCIDSNRFRLRTTSCCSVGTSHTRSMLGWMTWSWPGLGTLLPGERTHRCIAWPFGVASLSWGSFSNWACLLWCSWSGPGWSLDGFRQTSTWSCRRVHR